MNKLMNGTLRTCIDSSEVRYMGNKKLWTGILCALGMLALIVDGKTALEAGGTGIALCIKVVIPSLFPFFLLSNVLTGSLMGSPLPFLRPLAHFLKMPSGSESLLIAAFLGGYPVGAQNIAQAYQGGFLNKRDAEILLGYCNNAGPSFLFGMVGAFFPGKWMIWMLWGIHIMGALAAGQLVPPCRQKHVHLPDTAPLSISAALHSSIRVMAAVCGWVVLFRVLIGFLNRWILWLLPTAGQVAVIGLLELTNGCCELANISDISTRFCLCAGILSFGGLCVTMQTKSVTSDLSLKYYFFGKAVQTVFSVALAAAIAYGLWLPFCGVILAFLIIRQKRSSIPAAVGV